MHEQDRPRIRDPASATCISKPVGSVTNEWVTPASSGRSVGYGRSDSAGTPLAPGVLVTALLYCVHTVVATHHAPHTTPNIPAVLDRDYEPFGESGLRAGWPLISARKAARCVEPPRNVRTPSFSTATAQ